MFEGIGKIHDYANQKMLHLDAKVKIKTGRSLREQVQSGLSSLQTQTAKTQENTMSDEMKLMSIRQKLKSGRKLSSTEMNYLKENEPDLYSKAKKAEEAREELKLALKHARTKSEARQAIMQASVKAAAEAIAELKGKGGGALNLNSSGGPSAPAAGQASPAATAGAEGLSAEVAADINAGGDTILLADSAAPGNAPAAAADMAGAVSEASVEAVPAEASQAGAGEGNTAEADEKEKESPLTELAEQRIAEHINALKQLESNNGGKFELDEKFLFVIRALQDEWRQFVSSKDYAELPESPLDKSDTDKGTGKKRYENKGGSAIDFAIAAQSYRQASELLH